MLLISLLLLIPATILLFRKRLLRILTPRGIPDIPAYPDPKPIWGDIHRFKDSMQNHGGFQQCFDDMVKNLGAISQIRLGYFKTFIVLADLPTIEHVLLKQHRALDRAYQTTSVFRGLVPTGQIALDTNEQWKHHRRIVGPAMTSKYLSLATPLANQAVMDMVEYFKVKMELCKGKSWAVEQDFEGGFMDAICSVAFGSSWGVSKSFEEQIKATGPTDTGPKGEATFHLQAPDLHESMLYVFASVDNFSPYPVLTNFITSLKPNYRKHNARLNQYLKQKTDAARQWARDVGADAAVETATNTLDMMVARELRGEDWMSEAEMRDELYLYLIAGTETSATTLSWWVKYMTTHPEIQRKLRQHILDKIPEIQDRPPTYEELNPANVPYLEAVVHETLRISRTAGGYAREAKEDMVILGKRVPKGTTVIIPTLTGIEDIANPIYAVPSLAIDQASKADAPTLSASLDESRDPAASRRVGFWAAGTGKLYQPERWLDKAGNFDINAGPSLPFSLGQRACFGKNLALLELRLFMCQLNQAFFFAPVPEDQNSFEKYETITTHPRACFVNPQPWKE